MKFDSINEAIADDIKPYVNQACDKRASSWLNSLLMRKRNLDLNKEEFKDALRLCYNSQVKNIYQQHVLVVYDLTLPVLLVEKRRLHS